MPQVIIDLTIVKGDGQASGIADHQNSRKTDNGNKNKQHQENRIGCNQIAAVHYTELRRVFPLYFKLSRIPAVIADGWKRPAVIVFPVLSVRHACLIRSSLDHIIMVNADFTFGTGMIDNPVIQLLCKIISFPPSLLSVNCPDGFLNNRPQRSSTEIRERDKNSRRSWRMGRVEAQEALVYRLLQDFPNCNRRFCYFLCIVPT